MPKPWHGVSIKKSCVHETEIAQKGHIAVTNSAGAESHKVFETEAPDAWHRVTEPNASYLSLSFFLLFFILIFPHYAPISSFWDGNEYSMSLYVGSMQLFFLIVQKITPKRLPWVSRRDFGLVNSWETIKDYGDLVWRWAKWFLMIKIAKSKSLYGPSMENCGLNVNCLP